MKPLVETAIILSHLNYKMSVPATEEAEAKHAVALPVGTDTSVPQSGKGKPAPDMGVETVVKPQEAA